MKPMNRSTSPAMMLQSQSNDYVEVLTPNSATSMSEKNAEDDNEGSAMKVSSNSITDMIPLNKQFEPGQYDVICARGKMAYNHPGNRRFRKVVEENLVQYSKCQTKLDKSLVVSKIVDTTRQATPEGGFVKHIGGQWYEVGDRNAREKVGQAFRDLLHTQYRSSTKAKAMRKKGRASSPSRSRKKVTSDVQMLSRTPNRTICNFVIAYPCGFNSYQTGPASMPTKTYPPERPADAPLPEVITNSNSIPSTRGVSESILSRRNSEPKLPTQRDSESKQSKRRNSDSKASKKRQKQPEPKRKSSIIQTLNSLDNTSTHSRISDLMEFDCDPFEEAVDRIFLPSSAKNFHNDDSLVTDYKESNMCNEIVAPYCD